MLSQTGQNVGGDCSCCSRDSCCTGPPGGATSTRTSWPNHFDDFAAGKWMQLLHASRKCDEEASVAMHRKRRRDTQSNEMERRAARALSLVQMGELSSGRQALEGASLAPGSDQTLNSLRDPDRRPPRPRDPIPRDILEHQPAIPFELEEFQFVVNLRISRRGAVAGPSGMTSDHLRPLLDHVRDSHLLFLLGSVGQSPNSCICQRRHPVG